MTLKRVLQDLVPRSSRAFALPLLDFGSRGIREEVPRGRWLKQPWNIFPRTPLSSRTTPEETKRVEFRTTISSTHCKAIGTGKKRPTHIITSMSITIYKYSLNKIIRPWTTASLRFSSLREWIYPRRRGVSRTVDRFELPDKSIGSFDRFSQVEFNLTKATIRSHER